MRYLATNSTRDLRVDFLRGLVMVGLVVIHLEFASVYSMFVWGRVGLVSTAEGFVFLSGLVVGMVFANRARRESWSIAAKQLWRRAWQLYRVNLFIILSIAFLSLLPFINTEEVMSWTSVTGGATVWLYPSADDGWQIWLKRALLLESGPHQFQIIGLYIVLIAFSPLALWLCLNRFTWICLGISAVLYGLFSLSPTRLTNMQFEYGFPILAWQILFFVGLAMGVHRQKISTFMHDQKRVYLFWIAVAGSLLFLFLALNTPHPIFWPGDLFDLIPEKLHHQLYLEYFQKSPLGIGRLINNACLFIVAYYLLTQYWTLFEKIFGWFLIPIGQASLTVFFLHVYIVLIVSNTGLVDDNNFWLNTALHAVALTVLWCFAKRVNQWRWLPR